MQISDLIIINRVHTHSGKPENVLELFLLSWKVGCLTYKFPLYTKIVFSILNFID